MPYPKSLLSDDEEIVTDESPHWTTMGGGILMVALAILATVALALFESLLGLLGLIVVLVTGIGLLGQVLRWRTTHFILTNERIISRYGVLSKNGLEIPLDRVTNISYKQSFTERILGAGDIMVESAGEQGQQRFSDMPDPVTLQNKIYRQVEIAEDEVRSKSHHDNSNVRSNRESSSIPEQIEQLADLRKRKIISFEEFEEKKQELLDRM